MADTVRISIPEATDLLTVAFRGVGVAEPVAACVASRPSTRRATP
jgi:hypothetical protein